VHRGQCTRRVKDEINRPRGKGKSQPPDVEKKLANIRCARKGGQKPALSKRGRGVRKVTRLGKKGEKPFRADNRPKQNTTNWDAKKGSHFSGGPAQGQTTHRIDETGAKKGPLMRGREARRPTNRRKVKKKRHGRKSYEKLPFREKNSPIKPTR